MIISDLSYFQSAETATVKGGGYFKNIEVEIEQKAYAGEVYVKAYKSDVSVYANAKNYASVSIG